jgi:cysteine desulfurase
LNKNFKVKDNKDINSQEMKNTDTDNFNSKKYIYFDHAATTPVLPEVVEAVNECFIKFYGNASEPHLPGRQAKEILESSRQTIAQVLGAKDSEITFTGGGTESDNLAISGIAEAYSGQGNHIITSEIEHPAVLMPLKFLARKGFKITSLPVDKYGMVDPSDVKKALRDTTILVTIMHANNIVGTIQPIEEIGRLLADKNVIFHTDAVQTFCSAGTSVDKLGVDLLSISGHKIYGPKGVGALYVRKGTKIIPLILGGGQEKGRRSGTENIPGIAGLASAARAGFKTLDDRIAKLTAMREYLKTDLLKNIDDVRFNGHPVERLPGNCNFSFKFIEGEAIVLRLDMAGIAASSGSACSSSSMKPTHTLIAMGLSGEEAFGSLRITLGFENTYEEIDYFLETIKKIIMDLRNISPLFKKGR